MIYRRFGRTGLSMPVFSCGGMRYQQSWNDKDKFTAENQQNLEATIHRSIEIGINHIETARGYGTSEEQLGHVLPRLPRDKIIVQTKVGPEADPQKFLANFERSLSLLQLDYVDLLGLHGINNEERLEQSVRKGGCLEAALKLKQQGRVKHVGFSTHAGLPVILAAINDGRFDYVNLHWYYVNPFNWPAIEAATKLDMGVFIISPNDKGGKLYQPSIKLAALTQPFSPMVFNDLWCLSRPQVHTLSLGAARPSDFDEHLKALPYLDPNQKQKVQDALRPVEVRLQEEMVRMLGHTWYESWHQGLPDWREAPGEVNVFEILRLRNFARAFDMIEYGKMRYNLLGKGDHWFPGNQADKVSTLDFKDYLRNSPHAASIPKALEEAHRLLSGQEVKRLGTH